MLWSTRKGILAYFEERRTSGLVEGINNKVRVVMRRGGIRNVTTLWSRVVLDANWAWRKVGHTIASIRQLVDRVQAYFVGVYT